MAKYDGAIEELRFQKGVLEEDARGSNAPVEKRLEYLRAAASCLVAIVALLALQQAAS
ncbi:MAG: hypothetical protein AAB955_03870 [Patescibacteria group bacterium]